jgi:hypothetical protein
MKFIHREQILSLSIEKIKKIIYAKVRRCVEYSTLVILVCVNILEKWKKTSMYLEIKTLVIYGQKKAVRIKCAPSGQISEKVT